MHGHLFERKKGSKATLPYVMGRKGVKGPGFAAVLRVKV